MACGCCRRGCRHWRAWCVYDDRDLLLETVSLVVDNLDSVGNEVLHRERGGRHGGRYGVAATTVQDVFAVIPVVPHLVLVGVRSDMDDQGGGIVGIDLERIKEILVGLVDVYFEILNF